MASEILEVALSENYELTVALLCQLLKVLHQVSLDHGSWESTSLLWAFKDPLSPEAFVGDEDEMVRVHTYQKAQHELRGNILKGTTAGGGGGGDGGPEEAEQPTAATPTPCRPGRRPRVAYQATAEQAPE